MEKGVRIVGRFEKREARLEGRRNLEKKKEGRRARQRRSRPDFQ